MSDNVVFDKEMAKDYTILIPMMCPIHFTLLKNVLVNSRYKVELLDNTGPGVIEAGLKYVHNDTCYPALLVIGQMIDALKSGKYDVHKTALIITQTGGGCRASNYIYLLRKALKKADLAFVPVISLNFSGLDSQPGFKINLNMFRKMLAALLYGDLLMDLENQTKVYTKVANAAEELTARWIEQLSWLFKDNKAYRGKELPKYMRMIVKDYAALPLERKPKVKVGIVGEIYIKYSSLGNNNLEAFLKSQDCEVRIPGVVGFILYSIYNVLEDGKLYGDNNAKVALFKTAYKYILNKEKMMNEVIRKNSDFMVFDGFEALIAKAEKVIGLGTKMGEGWLLTGEIMELVESGYKNVICTQPFGCLPNHIVGKGMVRKIRTIEKDSNIVAIDYDPGATSVNQENRIKLMLAIAKEALEKDGEEK